MKDLFGEEVAEFEPRKGTSPYIQFKGWYNYRLSDSKDVRCKNCEHLLRQHHHDKKYKKCVLMGVSRSSATDIKVGHVCDKWQKAAS